MSRIINKSKDLLWQESVSAIDNNIDAMRDDLIDKGWDNEQAIQDVLFIERDKMLQEAARNIDGDYSQPYKSPEFVDLNTIEYPDEIISPEERTEMGKDSFIDTEIEDISVEELSSPQIVATTIPSENPEDLINYSSVKENSNEESVEKTEDLTIEMGNINDSKGKEAINENENAEQYSIS